MVRSESAQQGMSICMEELSALLSATLLVGVHQRNDSTHLDDIWPTLQELIVHS